MQLKTKHNKKGVSCNRETMRTKKEEKKINTHLKSVLPCIVLRFEKTDRSDRLLGQDWILRMSENVVVILKRVYSHSRCHHNIIKISLYFRSSPVISWTVLKTFNFSGSRGGMPL